MPLFQVYHAGCDHCDLKKEWPYLKSPVMPMAMPEEPSDYRIVVVGEAPGETEDEKGIPFVGKTGQLLRETIPKEWRRRLHWTNVVACRPPDNRNPSINEISSCASTYLEKDLERIRPHAILGVGSVPLSYFWPGKSISQIRGIPFPITLENGWVCWYYPIFHPSFVARSTRKDYDSNKEINVVLPVFKNDVWNFFKRMDEFTTPPVIHVIPEDKFIYPKTAQEALNLFDRLKDPYAHDVETFKLKPYMRDARLISAAFSDGETNFAFPVSWPGASAYAWGQQVYNTIMRSKKRWIAQFAGFELIWVWDATKKHDQNFEDVAVLARLYHKRSKSLLNLETQSFIHLGINIKDEGKINVKKMTSINQLLDHPMEKVLRYNLLDAWAEYLLYKRLASILPQEQWANYYRTMKTIKSVVAMEINGLSVSLDESEKLQKQFQIKFDDFNKQAKTIKEVVDYQQKESRTFQLSAPIQVGKVLVDYCGFDLPKTKDNNYSTDESYLEKFLGKHPLIDLVLDFREVAKLLSTYIDPILTGRVLGADGLLHPSYTTILTFTFRLSSEDPNIQNFPKRKHREIRRQIVAPPGFILAAYDFGQLEARTTVMASKDKVLKQQFIDKVDIHTRWLNRVLKAYPKYIDRLREKSGETDEKKILKAGRDTIKTDFVFASLYGSLARSIANRAMLPLAVAEEVLGEFWGEYAATKTWIDGQFEYYNTYGHVKSLTGRIRDEVLPGNEVINTPIQGTGAEIVLEAQTALTEMALTVDPLFLPRINIHDDLVFILRDDDNLEQYISTIGKEIVKPRFQFVNLPLTTECRVGYDWANLESVTTFEGTYFAD